MHRLLARLQEVDVGGIQRETAGPVVKQHAGPCGNHRASPRMKDALNVAHRVTPAIHAAQVSSVAGGRRLARRWWKFEGPPHINKRGPLRRILPGEKPRRERRPRRISRIPVLIRMSQLVSLALYMYGLRRQVAHSGQVERLHHIQRLEQDMPLADRRLLVDSPIPVRRVQGREDLRLVRRQILSGY